MKGTFWANVALFATVIALALFAWLKPLPSEPEFKLSTLKAVDAKGIRIEAAGAPPIVLERTTSDWQITTPIAARADNFQVQRLLGVLDATSKDRFPAAGLARFDLNEPYARLTVNQQTFSFGAVNPVSREQYVQTQEGIHLVGMQYGAALPKSALQLASKQLFAADEAPIAFGFDAFKLAQQDGKWQLTPAADASPDDINRWVDEWRLATAIAVLAPSDRKPLAAIKVKLKGGGDITLAVLQREPELVIARSDQKFEYQFAGPVARRLLSPPAAGIAK
jgi:hypothetical protein